MHEQAIVESLFTMALEHAEKAKASKVVRIDLVVGELTGVLEEPANFYFNILKKDTIASQANLAFTHTPALLLCRNCNKVFVPQKLNFHCPVCQEQQVDIVSGRELYIESIAVE
jgi:hydrogenase nickel incorporation protein HypA/HybF